MSFQNRPGVGALVCCDLCGELGAIFDRGWRLMPPSAPGREIHLCRGCRKRAVWCPAHQRYHRPDDLHRRPCASCGGLFTASVSQAALYCPSCQRARPPQPAAPGLR